MDVVLPARAGPACKVVALAESARVRTAGIAPSTVSKPLKQRKRGFLVRAAEPPSPAGTLPLLGDLLTVTGNLEKLSINLAQQHREQNSRILKLKLPGQTIFHLRHPEDIIEVMSDRTGRFAKPPGIQRLHKWLGTGLPVQIDSALHSRQRELLNPAFRSDYLKKLAPGMAVYANEVKRILLLHAGGVLEVQDLCRRAALDIIGKAAFDHEFEALAHSSLSQAMQIKADPLLAFDGLNQAAMRLAYDLPLPDSLIPGYRAYCDSVDMLDNAIRGIVNERRTTGIGPDAGDLLSYMMCTQQTTPTFPTDKQIRDEMMSMVFAGSDTVSSTAAFLLWALANHQNAQDRCRADIAKLAAIKPNSDTWSYSDMAQLTFVTACINETLRLFNAAVGAPRLATEATELGGYPIRKGAIVISDIYTLHRNENFWPQPDDWIPERFLPEQQAALGPSEKNAFLPFLIGPRSCIGQRFAIMELQTLAVLLLKAVRFKPASRDVDIIQDMTLRSRTGIWLQVEAVVFEED
ncbi:hypothetical protein WJX73_010620 [Symbiochloris irregularis]|uniref:Cytochrome P450 n=1 Tax=Symbiochloris irregularis TaxID=706552 RepID=A0AAW1NYY1_9CHLO